MVKRGKKALVGVILGLTFLMVGCSSGNSDEPVVEVTNKEAEVTTEKGEDGVVTQTEVWQEKDEITGEEYEVEVTKDIEDGKVVNQYEVKSEIDKTEKVETTVAEPLEETDKTGQE